MLFFHYFRSKIKPFRNEYLKILKHWLQKLKNWTIGNATKWFETLKCPKIIKFAFYRNYNRII